MRAIRPGSWPMQRPLWTGSRFTGTSRRHRKKIKEWRKTAVGADGLEPPTLSV
jgi:hypothetical protein